MQLLPVTDLTLQASCDLYIQSTTSFFICVFHCWFSGDATNAASPLSLQENEVQDGSDVAVILCGHKDMTEKLTSQMQAAGVAKEKILTNY